MSTRRAGLTARGCFEFLTGKTMTGETLTGETNGRQR
jgi:hypothetical protein